MAASAPANNTTCTGVSSPSDSLVFTSPAISTSSLSSSKLDFVAVGQRSLRPEQPDNGTTISTTTTPFRRRHVVQSGEDSSFSDDDEIVWGLSESEVFEGSTSGLGDALSDDDFVVLSRTLSPVSGSRDRSKTSEFFGSQTGTIQVVQPGLVEPRPSAKSSQGTDDVIIKASRERNGAVVSELTEELAKLDVNTESLVGQASETRMGELLEPEPRIPGALPKKTRKKAKKDRTPEEEELRKQKKKERKEKKRERKEEKEKEKQEMAAATVLLKGKEAAAKVANVEEKKKSKPKQPNESVIATPVATSMPVGLDLSKNVSTATLVPPSNTTTSITPESAILPDGTTPVLVLAPLPSPPLESVKTRTPVINQSPEKKRKKVKKVKATELTTPTQHNTVIAEKVSEQTYSDKSPLTPFDEAANYITSYISNASAHHDPVCHLTLLQSLAIELGLIKDISLLPRSIRAAKRIIKSRVFLNIKDYIGKRHEGPRVVQDLMFPTRSALVRDMKKKKNFASLQWIKKHGLQDLLVGIFHH